LNSDEMTDELRSELDKWDTDKNGLIDLNEFEADVQARVQQIFSDRNAQRGGLGLAPGAPDDSEERKPPVAYRAGKLPKELPAWFTQLDTNQDAQISLFEWRASGRTLQEFAKIDRNDDGFLTVDEVLRYEAAQGRTPQNLAGGGGTPGMPFGMVGLAPGASG